MSGKSESDEHISSLRNTKYETYMRMYAHPHPHPHLVPVHEQHQHLFGLWKVWNMKHSCVCMHTLTHTHTWYKYSSSTSISLASGSAMCRADTPYGSPRSCWAYNVAHNDSKQMPSSIYLPQVIFYQSLQASKVLKHTNAMVLCFQHPTPTTYKGTHAPDPEHVCFCTATSAHAGLRPHGNATAAAVL